MTDESPTITPEDLISVPSASRVLSLVTKIATAVKPMVSHTLAQAVAIEALAHSSTTKLEAVLTVLGTGAGTLSLSGILKRLGVTK